MAKQLKHGRNGRILIAATSGGVAVPVEGRTEWSISMSTDKVDATSFGDTTKVKKQGLADATITFKGHYDFTADILVTAALDGLPRAFYLYPDSTDATDYFFGTGAIDGSFTVPLAGMIDADGTISPDVSVSVHGLT